MADIELCPMQPEDWDEVAELIYLSTNDWYQTRGLGPIFPHGPESTRLFCQVYEALDPGCCILAVNTHTDQIAGSCFYHPRETHVSLGIMNVHPTSFGAGIAGRLLKFIIEFAETQKKPIRLVSSAFNLDSFSLYNRAGFIPRMAFQDMLLAVPESGLDITTLGGERVRSATMNDVQAMAGLELEINHISREKDFRYFVENESDMWHVSVSEDETGKLDGFLVSVQHPGSNMLGPGIARTDQQAAALILAELQQNRGRTPVFLVPVERAELVQTLYGWGARNCEIHFAQIRGDYQSPTGVVMPTFMPETG